MWICTVCHQLCEFLSTTSIKQSDGSECGILIYSAWQGLVLFGWKKNSILSGVELTLGQYDHFVKVIGLWLTRIETSGGHCKYLRRLKSNGKGDVILVCWISTANTGIIIGICVCVLMVSCFFLWLSLCFLEKSNGTLWTALSVHPSCNLLLNHWAEFNQTCYMTSCMVRVCESNIIFHFSLLSGESMGICDCLPSTVQSSFLFCFSLHGGFLYHAWSVVIFITFSTMYTVCIQIYKYKYSQLSLSRIRLFWITAYLEAKIWSLF